MIAWALQNPIIAFTLVVFALSVPIWAICTIWEHYHPQPDDPDDPYRYSGGGGW